MTEVNQSPLLSIIIPTKNRQHTCLYAIESGLLLNKTDIEIIIQDCSDSNKLEKQIIDKFGIDARINYEYTDTKPSMTENWNRAFERSKGLYKCGIGDDDAVLPSIYNITKWAKDNNIEAVGHSKKYSFFWPDFTARPEMASKLLVINSNVSEKVKIFERNELDELLKQQATIPDSNYRKLPMVYHCLLASSLIDNLIMKTGRFMDGTSLDVYTAISLGLIVNKFYVYEMPFTLPGACGASNSNRITSKIIKAHFTEFKNIVIDERIPEVYNETFTIAESTLKAFSNMNDVSYSKLLDLPHLYADLLSHSFNTKIVKDLYRLMYENKFSNKDYLKFSKLYFFKKIFDLKINLKVFIKKILYNSKYIKNTVLKSKEKKYALYESDNILEAIEILKSRRIL